MEAAISPLCGATIRTSTPLVSMLSACLVCTASSPFATWTSSTAPISLARCSTRRLSRCQRSSFNVSMEKPIRIGPLCGARVVPAVEVCCGSFTQDALSRRQNRTNIFLIARSFAPLLYQTPAFEVESFDRGPLGRGVSFAPLRGGTMRTPNLLQLLIMGVTAVGAHEVSAAVTTQKPTIQVFQINNVGLTPTSVIGGGQATGVVTLVQAGSGTATVTLRSSSPQIAAVP